MKSFYLLLIACIWLSSHAPAQTAATYDSLFRQANQTRNDGDYEKAIGIYRSCLDIATHIKDSLRIGNAWIGIGIARDQAGNFEEALQHYFHALGIYEKIGNKKKIGGTLKNIGNTYRVLKNYPKATLYLDQALDVQIAQQDSASIGNVLNDIGLLYMDQDSAAHAYTYFDRIIKNYSRNIGEEVRSYVLNNLALTLSQTNRLPQAIEAYQASLTLMKKRDDQYGIALVLGNIGDCYFRMHDLPKALDYHLRNLDIVKTIHSNELLKDSYDNLARTAHAMGNNEKAYEYTIAEMQLKDSIYQEQSARSLAEMEARYQNEKGQREILDLRQRNSLAEIQLLNQRLTKYILIAGILVVLVAAAFIYRNYRNKKRVNRELNFVNDKLSEANQSKTKLIGIITHDLRSPVSNLFSFLQLKKRRAGRLSAEDQEEIDKELTRSADNLLSTMEDLLVWSKSQMDSFALNPEKVELDPLLEEIVRLHRPLAEEKQITLHKQAPRDLRIETDPNFIRIILRNLVGNAIKFTPSNGLVELTATQTSDGIHLIVKDNGPGISRSNLDNIFEWNSIRSDSSGLGLRLAKEFATRLNASLSVNSNPGQGTEFTLTLAHPNT